MLWYGWVALALMQIVLVCVFPLRVDLYGAFSLFDAKLGLRLRLYGLPMLRFWGDLPSKECRLNGKRVAWKKEKHAQRIKNPLRYLRLLSRLGPKVETDLLLGTQHEENRWLPLAVCDVLSAWGARLRVYSSSQADLKGVVKVRLVFNLWDVFCGLVSLHRG